MTSDSVPRLVPAPGRLVVEALEETMWGGLYLPPAAVKEKPSMGRVIGLPSRYEAGVLDPEAEVYELGEVVVFGQNSGMQVDIGAGSARRRAIILREQDVLAKVVYDNEGPLVELQGPDNSVAGGYPGARFEYVDRGPQTLGAHFGSASPSNG